jgi:UDP-2,3-diacylglucosamine pyrophosphatase LpxH
MKKAGYLITLLAVLLDVFFASCRNPSTQSSNLAGVLTFEPNIVLSGEADNPAVNKSVQTIDFNFSEPLDTKTISGAVTLYKMDSTGKPNYEPCIIKTGQDNPSLLQINYRDERKFPEGEEYQIIISQKLKAQTGRALEKEYIGYFATNPAFILTGNPDLNNIRSQIVIISDLHIGVNDSFSQISRNRPALVDFLNRIRNSPNVKELVINGDFLDEWCLPMDYVMPSSESALVDAIAANNKTVIDACNSIIRAGNIKVTFAPGNHDMLVTRADMQRIFPGINQAPDNIQGLGTYVTGADSEIAIEHGHRYNFFCSPDPISGPNITLSDTSVLPPAYFMNRIGTSSKVEGHPTSSNVLPAITANVKDESQFGYYLYARAWAIVLSQYPVKEAFSDKVLKTNIDGFTEDYAIYDFIPRFDPYSGKLDVNLYKGVQDNWAKRQELDGVPVKIPLQDAILKAADDAFSDSQAKIQYFDRDSSKRIVVFGHTHVARLDPYTNLAGRKTIYANSGTWIDNAQGAPSMTFIVITPPGTDSAIESVNLYRYTNDTTVTQLEDTQVITIR